MSARAQSRVRDPSKAGLAKMPESRNGAGHQVAVRLSDVPLKIRRRFGARLYENALTERDFMLAVEIETAIERPSEQVYWLPEKSVRKVLRPRMR